MYCSKCGNMISDDSVFCNKCGARIGMGSGGAVMKPEIDREALKLYLHDLLALECIRRKYLSRISTANGTITRLKCKDVYRRYPIKPEGVYLCNACVHLKYNGQKFYIAYESFWRGIRLDDTLPKEDELWRWQVMDQEFEGKMEHLTMWKMASYPFLKFYEGFDKRTAAKDYYFANIHNDFKSNAAKWYQDNVNTYNASLQDRTNLNRELADLDEVIRKAYDLNIIPKPFRNNVYAVYYLYEFIRTSRESLTTALLHLDLNEIKRKLDKIIEQQQEIIIQQAITVARNQELLMNNKKQLQRMASIESNASLSSKYAEIAACNARACAWIGLANYLRR